MWYTKKPAVVIILKQDTTHNRTQRSIIGVAVAAAGWTVENNYGKLLCKFNTICMFCNLARTY